MSGGAWALVGVLGVLMVASGKGEMAVIEVKDWVWGRVAQGRLAVELANQKLWVVGSFIIWLTHCVSADDASHVSAG